MGEKEEPTSRFDGVSLTFDEPVANLGGLGSSIIGVPSGIEPLFGSVQKASSDDAKDGHKIGSAKLVVKANTVFHLLNPAADNASNFDSGDATHPVLPALPEAELGSGEVAAALKACSLSVLLGALEFGVVLIPVVRAAGGVLATRLFASDEGCESANNLYVFSSAAALAAFLGEDSERYFIMRQGAGVIYYLGQHLDAINTVMFDPAGPAPVRVPAALLPSLVKIGTVSSQDAASRIASSRGVLRKKGARFRLRLGANWGAIDIADKATRSQQIQNLVAEQTRGGDEDTELRDGMQKWLATTTQMAAIAGGHQFGFVLPDANAVALSVVSYSHHIGSVAAGESCLDKIAIHLSGENSPDQELVDIETAVGQVLRHVRTGQSNPRSEGNEAKVLLIDYWMAAQGEGNVAHVAFSTPHVDEKDEMLMLTDNVLINGYWVSGDETVSSGVESVESPFNLFGGE